MNEIEILGVTKTYGNAHVVHDLTLTLPKATVFGFLGPNGAGKTSTIKMLVGLSEPTTGQIRLLGKSPSSMEVKRMIGFMPESPSFYLHLTGKEFLEFIGELFGLSKSVSHVHALLQEVDLLHAKDKKIRTYSKGMLQRLGLAQALINNPQILFLDEPLDGLDPLGRAEVKKIILKLKQSGKTIFFNTHILGDVAEICDTVGIIDKGRLIKTGSPMELSKGHRDLEDAFVHIIEEHRALGKNTFQHNQK